MTQTVPYVGEALFESEAKSLRKELHGRLGETILIERDDNVSRPYWKIDANLTSSIEKVAAGMLDGERAYMVNYHGTEVWDVRRHIDMARGFLQRTSAIPFYAYDCAWYPPKIVTSANPAGLGAGDYEVTVTGTSHDDDESLPSPVVAFTLAEASDVTVYVPAWPQGAPACKEATLYAAAAGGTRRKVATVSTPTVGWTPVTLSALPGGAQPVEPTASIFRLGMLRINRVNVNFYESPDVDGEHDGVLSVYCSRELYDENFDGWRTYEADEVTVAALNEVQPS